MNNMTEMKAQVLTAALPYIQKYAGKIVVVKYGGNAMIDEKLKHDVMSDIILLSLVGIHVILVHGGGPEISAMLKKLGKETRFIDGLRQTDAETAQVVQMVLAGKTNKDLVSLIGVNGGRAIGLCGIDGHMITARPAANTELGFVGEIEHIDAEPIRCAMNDGYIPVIATVGSDASGNTYNINADTAAAEIAAALNAESLLVLTDIRGIMKDTDDEASLIPYVPVHRVKHLIEDGVVKGGMIPKVMSCERAVRGGVKKATLIDGRIPHSILIEMFSDEGIGTMISGEY